MIPQRPKVGGRIKRVLYILDTEKIVIRIHFVVCAKLLAQNLIIIT